ncbi:MAG: tRNA 2-thiouridine(34) synthase MnmA [Patescibacteria group bacterium]
MSRVAMLMSGGVDSSVSAALLKEQGYEVIGFYILGWLGTPEFPCPWQKEEKDARAVADLLGIPFHTINLSKVYEREVIDRFFAGYQAGVTPNPDILCNREIKFKALWQAVRQFECDFLASGHYARCQQVPSLKAKVSFVAGARFSPPPPVGGRRSVQSKAQVSSIKSNDNHPHFRLQTSDLEPSYPAIFKPADKEKDQTYFLWGIEKAMLPKIIFPLGELTKPEVRQLAKKYKLPTATKKDSQGICFVGPLKVRQFLASRVKTKPGDVYLTDGRKVATHEGVELYTIGQRLAAGSVDWTGDVPPLFVIAKDITNNRLIVGADSQTFGIKLTAGSLIWLCDSPFDSAQGGFHHEIVAKAKIRYRQEDEAVHIRQVNAKLSVEFVRPVRALTAGQSIVFYSTEGQLLGGGIIELVPEQDETVQQLTKALDQTKI